MADQIDKLLPRLEGVKKTGLNKWLAKCPNHTDKTASFAVKLTDDGNVLIHCFAGCSVESILTAVGLTFSDLFPQRTARDFDPTKPRPKPPKFTASEMVRLCVFESTVISLAMASILKGVALSQADHDRVQMALDTIDEIRREVARA